LSELPLLCITKQKISIGLDATRFGIGLLEKLAIAAFIGILVVVTGVFANLPAVGQQSPNNRLDPDARKTRAAQPERFSSQ
jgi:hypothetical protein